MHFRLETHIFNINLISEEVLKHEIRLPTIFLPAAALIKDEV